MIAVSDFVAIIETDAATLSGDHGLQRCPIHLGEIVERDATTHGTLYSLKANI